MGQKHGQQDQIERRVICAADIHRILGSRWPEILASLGVPAGCLTNRHQPCPGCGGRDRYRFDNVRGRGDYICGQCGAGDGFKLLQIIHGWDFKTARRHVIEAAGIAHTTGTTANTSASSPVVPRSPQAPAAPTARVKRTLKESCAVEDCNAAVDYLHDRGLWPLPPGHSLRAHPSAEYWHEGQRIGRYPALIAPVTDDVGELVTIHVTYVPAGRKLQTHEPRKVLSKLAGHTGCAIRLVPVPGAVMGITEGIETALSATAIHGVPTWAAMSSTQLAKFVPPFDVTTLVIYADRDEAGLIAAAALMERLQGTVQLIVKTPEPPYKDHNDVLMAQRQR